MVAIDTREQRDAYKKVRTKHRTSRPPVVGGGVYRRQAFTLPVSVSIWLVAVGRPHRPQLSMYLVVRIDLCRNVETVFSGWGMNDTALASTKAKRQ